MDYFFIGTLIYLFIGLMQVLVSPHFQKLDYFKELGEMEFVEERIGVMLVWPVLIIVYLVFRCKNPFGKKS